MTTRIERARESARTLMTSDVVLCNLPTSQQWRDQVTRYASLKRRVAEYHQGTSMDLPTAEEFRKAKGNAEGFKNWYTPIEDHQVRSHHCFMNLGAWGSYANVDEMRKLYDRNDRVNDQLSRVLGTIEWLPRFILYREREDYFERMPGTPGSMSYRNICNWWGVFAKYAKDFYPTEPELAPPTVGYGLDDFRDDPF